MDSKAKTKRKPRKPQDKSQKQTDNNLLDGIDTPVVLSDYWRRNVLATLQSLQARVETTGNYLFEEIVPKANSKDLVNLLSDIKRHKDGLESAIEKVKSKLTA